jgi:trimethylamine---corrinoid protein Co-methyltransferase
MRTTLEHSAGKPVKVPAGMTVSKLPDAQGGGETGCTISIPPPAGATMIHEPAGCGGFMGTTFAGYVPDDDLLVAMLRTVRGIDICEDALSVEILRDTVMGPDHYLGHPQTFDRTPSVDVHREIADQRRICEWEKDGSRDETQSILNFLSLLHPTCLLILTLNKKGF